MSDRKKGKKGGKKHAATPVITDPRFSNVQTDPRYRLPSKRHTHVKLDKRFAHILQDKDFSRNAAVDRYGRKLARDDTKKHLERFYRLEDKNQDKDEDEDEDEEEDNDDFSVDDDEEVLKELKKADSRASAYTPGYDPARDGGFSSSSSEESSEEEYEDEDEEEEGLAGGEELEFPDKQRADVPVGEVTNRIAVVNLDWDNIRAEDLMAVFSSFMPAGGRVLNVTVYPSEFGKERMEKEETEGPPREIFATQGDDEDENESDEEEEEDIDSEEEDEEIKKSILKQDKGEEFNSTQLRKYQLERLRYFYAIMTFSTKDVAKHVYDNVDGAEYLTSANFFDLRFVPDDTDFSDDKPRDECKRIPDGYQPNDFVTDALQHSKVKLTWDMDDKSRSEAQARAFRGSRKDIDENDLKAYLASDSSEDEEEGGVDVVDGSRGDGSKTSQKEDERQRMRALLGLSAQPMQPSKSKSDGPVGEMEVTFTSGLAGGPNRDTIFENEPEESSLEKYMRKERERKQRRKEKLKGVKPDDEVDAENTKTDGEAVEEQREGDLGFSDPFFSDPTGKAATTARRKEERRKKREEREAEEAAAESKRAELELLMMDDDDAKSGMRHFDMTQISKAEKQARKKSKRKGKDQPAQEVVDNFEMNVSDPRFSRLFQSHEFAIDPTNPRFKATSGMKALLDEGRKRRRDRDERGDEEEPTRDSKKQKQRSKKASAENGTDDLKKLVEKVKRKTRKD